MKPHWLKETARQKIGGKLRCQAMKGGYATCVENHSPEKSFKDVGRVAENIMYREERVFVRRQSRNDRLRIIFKLWSVEDWPPTRIAKVLKITEDDVLAFIDVIEDAFIKHQKQLCSKCHLKNQSTKNNYVGGFDDF